MEPCRLLFLLSFIHIAILRSYAFKTENLKNSYWQSALPNTQLPKYLQKILQPDGRVSEAEINVKTTLEGSGLPTIGEDNYAEAQVEPGVTAFFLENDLHAGKKMKLYFPKTTNRGKLLPRKVAESIPFSTTKLSEILNHFRVQPGSVEAEILRQTIEECEQAGIKGEDKYCATSLESLVDFCVSKLGNKNIKVYSTEVDKETKQEYKIVDKGVKKIGDRSVVCHNRNYAYAVFYCHEIQATKAYMVSMVTTDGTKAEAVAVCHTDTRSWNHKHFAFRLLKIEPGTVPICHFLPTDSLVWVPN
ncbi:hypothetical protein FNV43_RR04726 [Rhamnella rubrinervis]|uniref:BURP domain-containing protein n=1 Tax=Rhamnella rubrinervis TaxID=2594499 RepID=A0A8K0MQD5_9ROSA|nr:hypothetical protein FNV43_RR04726 [Rhamnella rubrinervis]